MVLVDLLVDHSLDVFVLVLVNSLVDDGGSNSFVDGGVMVTSLATVGGVSPVQ